MNLKSILIFTLAAGLVISGVVIAVGAGLINNSVTTSLSEMRAIGSEISAYTLPLGYFEEYAVQFSGYSVLAANTRRGDTHIFLAQAPKGSALDADLVFVQASRNNPAGQNGRPDRLRVVGQQTAVIRGQEVTLLVSEGINGSGLPYRELTGTFEGRGGLALVNVGAPLEAWDQAAVDAFLASLLP